MNTRKIVICAGIALLAFFLVSQPHESAALFMTLVDDLRNGAEALITFVSSVFG